MTYNIFLALMGFAIVTVATPGPNNLMLMASGANYGWRRSVPHILGVWLGFPTMIFCVGLGVMQLFETLPFLEPALKVGSVLYMLWLAWKITQAGAPGEGGGGTPLTFVQASAFQWVNPKAWAMALSAITLYASSRDLVSVALVVLAYLLCGALSSNTWTLMGVKLRLFLSNPRRLTVYNWSMATLLIGSLVYTLTLGS